MEKTMRREGLEDIWILTDDGIVLFTTNCTDIDVQLFGGFLTALKQFAEVLTKGELKGIDIGIMKYYILRTHSLTFVASAKTTTKKSSIISQLNLVKSRFIESYPPEFFNDWNHNTNQFSTFNIDIENISMTVMS